jgi:putative ABC transport system substrate-binding protein
VIGELVNLPVDILVTSTVNPTKAAMQATRTIPIVFTGLADPVGRGIVASLSRPDSNVTGVATEGIELAAKRLELLKETVPDLSRLAVLTNDLVEDQTPLVAAMQQAGQALGIDVEPVRLASLTELEGALEVVTRMRPDAITTLHAYTFWLQGFAHLKTVLDFAVRHRLPQTYNGPEFVRAGGLMGLGEDVEDTYRNLAKVVDRILRGADPADVPVVVATRFLLALNLSMADRIGFTFPDSVRRQATEIIQ